MCTTYHFLTFVMVHMKLHSTVVMYFGSYDIGYAIPPPHTRVCTYTPLLRSNAYVSNLPRSLTHYHRCAEHDYGPSEYTGSLNVIDNSDKHKVYLLIDVHHFPAQM